MDDALNMAAAIVAQAKAKGESISYFHAVARLLDCECPESVARELANPAGSSYAPNEGTRVTIASVADHIRERAQSAETKMEQYRNMRDGYVELLRRFVGGL